MDFKLMAHYNTNRAIIGKQYLLVSRKTIAVFHNNEKHDTKITGGTSEPPMLTSRHGFVAETIDNKTHIVGGGKKSGLSVSNLNEVCRINKVK
jgi:hypothetical protein